MKANQRITLLTALLLAVTVFTACGSSESKSAADNQQTGNTGTAESSILAGDGIIEDSFGTVAGQSLPEATMPEKPEGCTPLTDNDGFKELQHKIHEANWKDSIFQNHSSLTLTLDDKFEHSLSFADYVYLAPDYSYGHASNYEQYSKDRAIYQLVGTDTNSPYPVYVADLSENYSGHVYWYVPQEEADFFDAEHETVTDAFTKDGVLWQYSVMDETGSKGYLDGMMGGEYGGEIVHCFEIVDAESYEIIEARQYAEKDGKTYLLGIHKMQYDLPEPEAISDLLKKCDKGGNDTATVTFVVNPGKENEISKSIEVPQYSYVSWYAQDILEADMFLDAECTKPVEQEWDGKSDITYYIVPHKE